MSGDGTVKKKITTRDMLLECLKWMEYKKLFYAADPEGLIPMEGMDEELTEWGEKCDRMRILIQGLESEPVRRALAQWRHELRGGEMPDISEV